MQEASVEQRAREAQLLAELKVMEDRLRVEQERSARLASEAQSAALHTARLQNREAEVLAVVQRIATELRGGHTVALAQKSTGVATSLALLMRVVDAHVRDANRGSSNALRQMMELAIDEARRLGPAVDAADVVEQLLGS